VILGCRVDAVDIDRALDLVDGFIAEGTPRQIVTLGTEMIVYAQRDAAYRDIVNASALSLCDTVGLLWASRLWAGPLRTRVAGVDFVEAIARRAATKGTRLYLVGGAPGVAQQAARAPAICRPGWRSASARAACCATPGAPPTR